MLLYFFVSNLVELIAYSGDDQNYIFVVGALNNKINCLSGIELLIQIQKLSCVFSLFFPLQKCIRFNPEASVWVAKQRILCTLNQSLKDVLNYGLFQPANNGRDGKFLDEERLLMEYPQNINKGVPSLEVLKKQVYFKFRY